MTGRNPKPPSIWSFSEFVKSIKLHREELKRDRIDGHKAKVRRFSREIEEYENPELKVASEKEEARRYGVEYRKYGISPDLHMFIIDLWKHFIIPTVIILVLGGIPMLFVAWLIQ